MPNDFIMIVGERDLERFRQFQTGHNSKVVQTKFGADNVWAVSESTKPDLWSKIKKNDRVFFARVGFYFSYCGIVQDTITDKSLPIELWGSSPRIRMMTKLILFSRVQEISEPLGELCRKAGIKPPTFTSIYAAKGRLAGVSVRYESVPGIVHGPSGPPDKKSEVVTRFIRDTRKVKQLKTIYHDECQVCGYTVAVSKKSRYSEVHHLHPLKDDGDDDLANMLVLCPTHHVEFDYKVIGIDKDKRTIVDSTGKPVGKLTMSKDHRLAMKNIKFHMAEMSRDEF